jgi:hypothetical protein
MKFTEARSSTLSTIAIALVLLAFGIIYGPALLSIKPVPVDVTQALFAAKADGGLFSWLMHLVGGALVWIPRRVMVAAAVVSGGVWPGFLATWIIGSVLALLITRIGDAMVPANPNGKREPLPVTVIRRYPLLCTLLIAITLPPYIGLLIFLLVGRAQVPWAKRIAGIAIGSVIPMAIVAFAGIAALPGPQANPPFVAFLIGGLALGLIVEGAALIWRRGLPLRKEPET